MSENPLPIGFFKPSIYQPLTSTLPSQYGPYAGTYHTIFSYLFLVLVSNNILLAAYPTLGSFLLIQGQSIFLHPLQSHQVRFLTIQLS